MENMRRQVHKIAWAKTKWQASPKRFREITLGPTFFACTGLPTPESPLSQATLEPQGDASHGLQAEQREGNSVVDFFSAEQSGGHFPSGMIVGTLEPT